MLPWTPSSSNILNLQARVRISVTWLWDERHLDVTQKLHPVTLRESHAKLAERYLKADIESF